MESTINNKKYKYIQIGIASSEDIISWANPVLQGKKFTYDPNHREKVTYIDDDGNQVEYMLKVKLKNLKQLTIVHKDLKKMGYSVK